MSYQPKTGVKCGCKRGIERDNCATCEGTGQRIDFAKIRARVKDPARPVGQYLMEANDNYADKFIENYFDLKTGKERSNLSGGDTLALFIGREIVSVYDATKTDKANRLEIEWQLRQAAKQLLTLSEHFTATAGGEL